MTSQPIVEEAEVSTTSWFDELPPDYVRCTAVARLRTEGFPLAADAAEAGDLRIFEPDFSVAWDLYDATDGNGFLDIDGASFLAVSQLYRRPQLEV